MTHSQRLRRRRRRRRSGARRRLLLALLAVLSLLGAGGAVLVGWVITTAGSAPRLTSLKERSVGANAEVLAADGTRLGFLQADDVSQPVSGSKLPKVLKDATVAIEDERFFDHEGVDYEGIVRAAVKNFANRKTVQGGSTITMQLVDRPRQAGGRPRGRGHSHGRHRPFLGGCDGGPRNGRILAMASTGEYDRSQFNLAAQGRRQPGSAFKTMALMTALREGVDPDATSYTSVSPTRIDDPVCGPPFEVKTYANQSGGRMSLRTATLKSDNSVYIQLAVDLGPDEVAETARDLGIRTKLNGYCAESLGGLEIGVSPLEMATAYATIANGGFRNRPTIIDRVELPGGRTERPRRWRVRRVKAFADGVTVKAVEILEANIQGGTGTKASIGCPAGGKTGTTDGNTDAWSGSRRDWRRPCGSAI
jgi:membrane peptidoglycan carboxypeptidase